MNIPIDKGRIYRSIKVGVDSENKVLYSLGVYQSCRPPAKIPLDYGNIKKERHVPTYSPHLQHLRIRPPPPRRRISRPNPHLLYYQKQKQRQKQHPPTSPPSPSTYPPSPSSAPYTTSPSPPPRCASAFVSNSSPSTAVSPSPGSPDHTYACSSPPCVAD